MLQLLQLEIKKFQKNSVVKMLLWIYLLAFPAILFIGKEDSINLPSMLNSKVFFTFPTMWDWLGYDGNWMVFFCLGFIVVYTISIEQSYKTMRQNIITGMNRNQYLTSKYLIVLLLAVFATLYYIIVGLIIGWLSTPGATFSMAMDNNWAFGRFFLMSLGYLSFAYMIGFLIKNSGLAVLTYLAYGILIEPLIRYMGHSRLFGEHRSMHFYPLNAMEDLMPLPFIKISEAMAQSKSTVLLTHGEAAIVSIISIAVFVGITYFIFNKKDI